MIRELWLRNFKCFKAASVSMAPLTLLTGVNSSGKSSVLQALVLLGQTFSEKEWGHGLPLNGGQIALGTVADVINDSSSTREISIGAASETESVEWLFSSENRRGMAFDVARVLVDNRERPLAATMHRLMPIGSGGHSVISALSSISWLSAERLGPRELLPLQDNNGIVGPRGEHAASVLYWRQDEDVREPLRVEGVPPTLLHQVRAQMQIFCPGADLRVSPVEGANFVSVRFRSNQRSEYQRPQNVGFGLTQLFPVLVAVLIAEPGDMLLIENPEVHLHPRAQQRLGELFARVAASGVQLVVETHSDHVLNGLRLAVKSRVAAIKDTAIHFFSPGEGDSGPQVHSPQIDAEGKIDVWPIGFFDQFDDALSKLL